MQLNEQESQRRARFSESKLDESAQEIDGLSDKAEAISNVSEIQSSIKKNIDSN